MSSSEVTFPHSSSSSSSSSPATMMMCDWNTNDKAGRMRDARRGHARTRQTVSGVLGTTIFEAEGRRVSLDCREGRKEGRKEGREGGRKERREGQIEDTQHVQTSSNLRWPYICTLWVVNKEFQQCPSKEVEQFLL